MRFKTFAAFVAPSMILMILFIAVPLVTVLWGSFHVTQPIVERVTQEVCTPGFPTQICREVVKNQPVIGDNGRVETRTLFVGLQSYREVMQPERAWSALSSGNLASFLSIDFWGALRFTLSFTFITLPLVILVGLGIALGVNSLTASVKGPVIFVSLLPFIVTPVIGGLSIYWLFVGDGIVTRMLETWQGTDIAFFAQAWTIELLMMFYRVWHVAPFAFVIFYAGLQTLNSDAIESAVVDGASRWERLRYIVIPHLMPLIVFVALIHLMDAYRVFEEIIAFRSEAYVKSLQYLNYDFLQPDDAGNRAISRASASSMLTMVGIVILLIPLLRKTWKDQRG